MATRLRERRRSSTRTPAVLRDPVVAGSGERAALQHGARRTGFSSWRVISAMIVLGLSAVLVLFFATPMFYVHNISVGGLRYLTKNEIYGLSSIADMHIFWVDPEVVRQNLLRSPTIADARVQVGWPPNMVQIIVEEREPALIWEQAGVTTWIDVQGRVMSLREDRSDLVRILAVDGDGPLGPNVQLPLDVVTGALQMKTLYPNIDVLRYDSIQGLGYQDGRGWMAWFGTGTDMPEKLLIYDAIVTNLLGRQIQPGEISVVNPDAPYYTALQGR